VSHTGFLGEESSHETRLNGLDVVMVLMYGAILHIW